MANCPSWLISSLLSQKEIVFFTTQHQPSVSSDSVTSIVNVNYRQNGKCLQVFQITKTPHQNILFPRPNLPVFAENNIQVLFDKFFPSLFVVFNFVQCVPPTSLFLWDEWPSDCEDPHRNPGGGEEQQHDRFALLPLHIFDIADGSTDLSHCLPGHPVSPL